MVPARNERIVGRRDGADQSRNASSPVEVSVVIPVLNEALNVPEMCRRLRQVLEPSCPSYEIIFVAGGSIDGTEVTVLKAHQTEYDERYLWK